MDFEVTCKAAVRTEDSGQLTAVAVADLLRDVPPDARLFSIMHDKGTQRDPYPVLVGLRAVWTERR